MPIRKIFGFVNLFVLFLFLAKFSIAQPGLDSPDNNTSYFKALQLFKKGNFRTARDEFESYKETLSDFQSLNYANAMYSIALCAIEAKDKDAEFLLDQFVQEFPYDQRNNSLLLKMGYVNYDKKAYSKTIKWLEKVDKTRLIREELTEYYFKLGYAYFVKEENDEARFCFNEIKDLKSEYKSPAVYYYSHLAYLAGEYQTALNGFESLLNDNNFRPIVPYYLIQIYYHQRQFKKIFELGPDLLAKATEKREPEIARIIGEAYFHENKYKEAIPFLLEYKNKTEYYSHEDIYQLAYAYYRGGQLDKAIEHFEKVARGKSLLAQNAYFHLADCYLQNEDKEKAMMAFSSASQMDFDSEIAEESLFNEAKLSFELSYSPFNQTIKSFDYFVRKYPDSEYIDIAYDYMVKVFMATKNYKQALVYLEKIENKNENIKTAYQRVAFFRAIELFSNLQFKQAIDHFNKSLSYSYLNPELKAQAIYWRGESYFRIQKYKEAIQDYDKYLHSPGSISQHEYNLAYYNLAYSYFKLEEYDNAVNWFRKFVNREDHAKAMICDAYIRTGDCYFKSRDYNNAVKFYDKGIALGVRDADYATFQKAFSYGLLHQDDKKNWVLRKMIEDFPESSFKANAMYELGISYIEINDNSKAIETFRKLIVEFPESNFVRKSYNKIGLIHYNQLNNDSALVAYKYVVENNPETDEAQSALIGIKNIYLEQHREDDYFKYIESLGGVANVSVNEKDSLTFYSAERLYMEGNCEKSLEHLKKYIQNFGDGNFILTAHYYQANCQLETGNELGALSSFDFIISRQRNKYTEEALLQAGRLNYKHENYLGAFQDFSELERITDQKNLLFDSRVGQMRSLYKLRNDSAAIMAANKVLISDDLDNSIESEAHYILSKSFIALGENESALNELHYLNSNTKSEYGAEACYLIPAILFQQGEIDKAEKEIMDFNDKNTPHQFWLAKAIILLADIMVEKDDLFQARHTLESVIQYYDEPQDGIIELAKQKLNLILEKEAHQNSFIEDTSTVVKPDSIPAVQQDSIINE